MSFELYKIEISLHLRKSQWRRNSASLKFILNPCSFLCTSPQQTLSILWELPVNWSLHFSWTTNDSRTTESVSYLCWKINITHFNSVEWTHFTQERNILKKTTTKPTNAEGKGTSTLKNISWYYHSYGINKQAECIHMGPSPVIWMTREILLPRQCKTNFTTLAHNAMWLLPQFYITRSLEQKFLWFVQHQALQENLLYNDVIFSINKPIPTK